MASSSSSFVQQKHQVFLSFRGEDTRNNFTSHLHEALKQQGIVTYIDDRLESGEEISEALLTAIEESTIWIIVLSKNYASSSWCLDELSNIVECKKTMDQKVVPIFYHVDPSDVRKQTGSFGEAFEKRFKDKIDKVERWKAALFIVGSIVGHHLRNDRCESEHIKHIVEDISKKLIYKYPNDFQGLVGINSHINEIESLLRFEVADVRILGIWGMGGIGKTTVAEAIFHKISTEFEGRCFLANVREKSEKSGWICLQNELLCEILEERNINIGTNLLPTIVLDRLRRKKVFIVLDDVDNSMQLDLLLKKDYFGPGSRIIVTSRDKQVFGRVVDVMYEVRGLNYDKALHLFSWYAFKQSHPKKDFEELSSDVVDYARGVPLALKVLGSALYDKSKLDWEGYLKKLKIIPNPIIDNILRINYDGLDGEVQDIFLDISCFFKGMSRDYVTNILDGCYISATSGISALIDKSLITISHDNKLGMHDLLQQMGWNIVCQESKELGKRSRLWISEDIYHVLKNNTGTRRVKGMFLDMSKIREVHLIPKAFARMYNLKYLKFYYSGFERERKRKVFLSQRLESVSDNLSYLHWDGYPSKSLPSNFCPENLVELIMPHSHLKQLWNGVQDLMKLKTLDLSYSRHLIKIPDLSRATVLERMMLDGCTSLVEVPSSIRSLSKLRFLSLEDCQNLGNFPSNIHLRSLTTLLLTNCSNLKEFPEISGNLENLCLNGTAIEEVPSSIGCLSRLKYLNMRDCKRLRRLPNIIYKLKSLEDLNLNGCLKLKSFPKILETMECLRSLYLSRTSIKELPSSIEHLVGLITLELNSCENLKYLPSSVGELKSLKRLSLKDCSNITNFQDIPRNLLTLDLSGTAIEQVPSSIQCLSELEHLTLEICEKLGSLPRNILKLKSLRELRVSGFSKLEVIEELLGTVHVLNVCPFTPTAKIDFKWSKRGQVSLSLSPRFDGLVVSLQNSIGKMKSLKQLIFSGVSVLDTFTNNLENLEALEYLCLSFCKLFVFRSRLTCIFSLRELNLSRNNFKTIPPSIIQLLELKKLNLSSCKRLRSLPELPPKVRYLNARDCTSLQDVSSAFPTRCGLYQTFIFTDCFNLNQKAILSKTQLAIQQMATKGVKRYHEIKRWPEVSSIGICFPGNAIPEWFRCQNLGSSVTTPHLHDRRKFVGFALCAVVAFEDFNVSSFNVHCDDFKTNDNLSFSCFFSLNELKRRRLIDSDHVFLYYHFNLYAKWYSRESKYHLNEVSFKFRFRNSKCNEDSRVVKKCGVCLLYAQGESESESNAEVCSPLMIKPSSPYDPTQLSQKCGVISQAFVEPMVEDGTTNKRPHDDYSYGEAGPSGNFSSDEEEEPHHKRLKNV